MSNISANQPLLAHPAQESTVASGTTAQSHIPPPAVVPPPAVCEAKIPAEAAAVPIVDPKVVKQQAKDQKTLEKTIEKAKKVDHKSLASAEKVAKKEIKAEAAAVKALAKAHKLVAKTQAKEAKYQKGLLRQQKKFDGAVQKRIKAEADVKVKADEHAMHVRAKEVKQKELQSTKAVVEQHDVQREAALKASAPAA